MAAITGFLSLSYILFLCPVMLLLARLKRHSFKLRCPCSSECSRVPVIRTVQRHQCDRAQRFAPERSEGWIEPLNRVYGNHCTHGTP
jgi:hypothetical protein